MPVIPQTWSTTCLPKSDLAFRFTSIIKHGESEHKIQENSKKKRKQKISFWAKQDAIFKICNEIQMENGKQITVSGTAYFWHFFEVATLLYRFPTFCTFLCFLLLFFVQFAASRSWTWSSHWCFSGAKQTTWRISTVLSLQTCTLPQSFCSSQSSGCQGI